MLMLSISTERPRKVVLILTNALWHEPFLETV
jgi:hypothetical protein